jgi:hypothetical protein
MGYRVVDGGLGGGFGGGGTGFGNGGQLLKSGWFKPL